MRPLALGLICLLAACGKSPSGPTPPPPGPPAAPHVDASGEWTGAFTYATCVGDRNCAFRLGRGGRFALRLTQSASSVTGLFLGDTVIGPVDVSGTVEADGSVRLAGTFVSAAPRDLVKSRKVEFSGLRLDAATGLAGQFTYEVTLGYEGIRATYGGTIASAEHRSLSTVPDLSGTWTGRFLVRGCIVTGSPVCSPYSDGTVEYLDLTLTGSGAAISGELKPVSDRIPLSGRANGATVELDGFRPAAPGALQLRVIGLAATADVYGRLSGRFTYVTQFNQMTTTYDIELIQVVKTL